MSKRAETIQGKTYHADVQCGDLFVTVNGEKIVEEVFVVLGHSGTCARAFTEALGRVITIAIRKDADVKKIIKNLKGISCNSAESCVHNVALILEKWMESKAVEEAKLKELPELPFGDEK